MFLAVARTLHFWQWFCSRTRSSHRTPFKLPSCSYPRKVSNAQALFLLSTIQDGNHTSTYAMSCLRWGTLYMFKKMAPALSAQYDTLLSSLQKLRDTIPRLQAIQAARWHSIERDFWCVTWTWLETGEFDFRPVLELLDRLFVSALVAFSLACDDTCAHY